MENRGKKIVSMTLTSEVYDKCAEYADMLHISTSRYIDAVLQKYLSGKGSKNPLPKIFVQTSNSNSGSDEK